MLCVSLKFISCDSTTSPENPLAESLSITTFEIIPSSVEFTLQEDGFRDTTVSLELFALVSGFSDSKAPRYAISEKSSGDIVVQGELSPLESPSFNFSRKVGIPTTTTSFENYIINIFFEEGSAVYAQTDFSIQGFSNNRPEILNTAGPNLINRPSSGEIPAVFTAKVTDDDGQENIDQVFIRVINQTSGEVEGSPFQMFDDGSTYTDTTANDSVYTWFQPVPPNENDPNRDFDIEFYVIDLAGLSSDTVRTTFRIRE